MLDRMTPRQQAFALLMSVALLVFVIEMVRRRKLREEYSWLWILVAVAIFVLSVWFGALKWLTNLIGAVTPVSTFFVFGILFLVVVNIYFSIKISTLTTQLKNQAQRLAILGHYLEELRQAQRQVQGATPAVPAGQPAAAADPAMAGPAAAGTASGEKREE